MKRRIPSSFLLIGLHWLLLQVEPAIAFLLLSTPTASSSGTHRTRVVLNAVNGQNKDLLNGDEQESASALPVPTLTNDDDDDDNANINQSYVEPFESQQTKSQQQRRRKKSEIAIETTKSTPFFDYDAAYVLFASAIIGTTCGFSVCLFKLSIESLREFFYGTDFTETVPIFLVPAIGGLAVSVLAAFGKFSPGLLGTANEIDALSIDSKKDRRFENASSFLRKPLAAIVTLGSGNSLGPEGPSVEVGMSISRIFMPPTPQRDDETYQEIARRINRNRLLFSSGAAAGVAAGFNAPLAGVFFALEIVQQFQPPLAPPPPSTSSSTSAALTSESPRDKWFKSEKPDFLSGPGSITAILLASVMSALISQVYLGDSLALSVPLFDLKEPLIELPLYLMLGVVSGFVAGAFSALAQLFKGIFDGESGPTELRDAMKKIPKWIKPALGGLIVGLIGTVYPQVLFFGYETLNTLLGGGSLVSTELVLSLLALKTFTTAISAGSGLVGGTFAPSLFLGGMTGAFFHDVIGQIFLSGHSNFELADVQAYALVGAAGVLAALFQAPLTASLLLFELTRDYEVILPVVAAASVGSVIGDLVEKNYEEKKRDSDGASWGDLSFLRDDAEDDDDDDNESA